MNSRQKEHVLRPIGVVHSVVKERYEAAHQGVLAKGDEAWIELEPGNNFEQATEGLAGIERIWVVYAFHLNSNWKPMVKPPRNEGKKVGVFATRAPYRPNGLGLSCVKIVSVAGLRIYISESDILDGSPVFDIKPYLPYSDSFPDAGTGWIGRRDTKYYTVHATALAESKAAEIREKEGPNLLNYAGVQLKVNAADTGRKRIRLREHPDIYDLTYRTRRIIYRVDEENAVVEITDIV